MNTFKEDRKVLVHSPSKLLAEIFNGVVTQVKEEHNIKS